MRGIWCRQVALVRWWMNAAETLKNDVDERASSLTRGPGRVWCQCVICLKQSKWKTPSFLSGFDNLELQPPTDPDPPVSTIQPKYEVQRTRPSPGASIRRACQGQTEIARIDCEQRVRRGRTIADRGAGRGTRPAKPKELRQRETNQVVSKRPSPSLARFLQSRLWLCDDI